MARILPPAPPRQSTDSAARAEFLKLTLSEKKQAIRRLVSQGYSDYGIAHATRLAVEQVRVITGERL